jgi:hypothetical protein
LNSSRFALVLTRLPADVESAHTALTDSHDDSVEAATLTLIREG